MLHEALKNLPGISDPNVLVGFETADDAGVYLLNDETALVQSVDFFTPIVDDPGIYGQVAAANALSDIYAMGGTPRFALSLVAFPQDRLEQEVLAQILEGGVEKMREAGVSVIGGHSVKDPELKFGYAVTGVAHPDRIYRNRGLQPGDALVLTKPLGTGIVATAIKFGRCPAEVEFRAVEWMLQLNRDPASCLSGFDVHAVTDITGFGLLGHALEMALASGVCLKIESDRVPLLEGVEGLAADGMLPGGIESNRQFLGESVDWHETPRQLQQLLLDPQTSGGLLVGLPAEQAQSFLELLEQKGLFGHRIGTVARRDTVYLSVS